MVCDGKLAATECCAAESAMLGRGWREHTVVFLSRSNARCLSLLVV